MKWESKVLADIASIGSGSGFPTKYQGRSEGSFPFYKVSDMNLPGNERVMVSHNNAIDDDVKAKLKAAVHPAGTIIFPKIGAAIATNKKRILTKPACFDNNVIGIHPSKNLDTEFLYQLLLQKNLSDFANTGNPPSIRKTTLECWKIPLPPLAEQKRIAGILEAADGLRAKRRAALAQLDTLLQSTFLDLFGDPVTNPKGWEMLELVEFCESKSDMKCGPFGTQLQVHEFKKEGVPLWGIRHVNSGFEKTTVEFVSKTKAKELEQYSLKAGDIVMTRKGTIGNCHVYPSTLPVGIMHSDLLRLRVSLEKCDPVFLSFQFMLSSRIKRQIALMSPGAVMPGINVSKLKRLSVENPPLDLQRRFATIVESVERQKACHREHLAQLDTLFASLQQRAFKGEL